MLIEEKVVSELDIHHSVISTGGSVVYSEKAMNTLKQSGRIVYLHVPYSEIERRLPNITSRGIVMKYGQTLRDLYEERVPLYRRYSDETVDCSNKDIEQCVNDVIQLLHSS